nr:hypothetical protein [Tanacetum cinerariifolium]
GQALHLLDSQHFGAIHKLARAAHQEVSGHVHGVVEVAVVEAVGAVLGDVEGVGNVDFELVALGLHGLGQDNLHPRIVHAVVGFQLLAMQLDGHGAQRVAALKPPRRVAEAPARRGRG